MAHTFNPSIQEAEAGRFLSSRPAWSTDWIPGLPGLHTEKPCLKNQKSNSKSNNNNKNQLTIVPVSGMKCAVLIIVDQNKLTIF